jgi:hypothetical protein
MIDGEELAAALRRLDPRDWEVLDLSLRRRVPDEALAKIFGSEPAEVARRRAAAIENLADALGVQRGEDLGAVLKALLDADTWKGAENDGGEDGWQAFSDPAAASNDPLPPAEPEAAPELKTSEVARLFRLTPAPDPLAPEPLPVGEPAPSAESAESAESAKPAEEPEREGEDEAQEAAAAAPQPESAPERVPVHGLSPHAAQAAAPASSTAAPAPPRLRAAPPLLESEPVLDMLSERDERLRGTGRSPLMWALAGGAGAAALLGAGWVGATQFDSNPGAQRSGGGGDQTRRFLPEQGGPLAAPFPSDPKTTSCYSTAYVRRATTIYSRPGGKRRLKLPAATEWGSPRVLSVVRRRGDWLAVLAPELRNGEVGWVETQRVSRIDCVRWSLHVDLSRRRVYVRQDGHTVRSFKVAIGSKRHPTPKGRFAVTDKLKVTDKGSPYGCCVLALTGHQNKLPQDWPGGDRLAVHATTDLSSIGKPVSLGCMRSNPATVRWLIKKVPLGSPIFIRS